MHYDPFMLKIVGAILGILGIVFVSRLLRQPHVVGYLLAGVVLGPHGLAVLTERATLSRLGEFGVLLLLFFIGMETDPRQLAARWRIAFVGTSVQIAVSILAMWGVGTWLGWHWPRIVLIGFVISLSSTALVLNYLRETGQMDAKIGKDALSVLLAQDVAVIPMLIIIDIFADGGIDRSTLTLQAIGAVAAGVLLFWIGRGSPIQLRLVGRLKTDSELQIFLAFLLCLGFAFIAEAFELSAALGAFLAGMLLGAARETGWVADRLEPFRIVFVGLFFVSVGLLVKLDFVTEHIVLVLLVTAAVLVGNTLISTLIFRALGDPWRYSLRAAAHLAQIGEFSFVLAAVGQKSRLITTFDYQLSIAVITATLILSPAWVATITRLQRLGRRPPRAAEGPALTEP